MPPPVPVVINRSSGRGISQDEVRHLSRSFAWSGLKVDIAQPKPSGLEAALARAAGQAPGLMVAGGGDGTISQAAGLAHESGLTLGILPTGTLNHFAKDLGLPLDLEACVEVIAGQKKKRVDLGEINGRIFINNVSLGLYPRAVKERLKRPWLDWAGRILGTGWALARALAHHPRERVLLEVQDERLSIHSHMIFIGNNRYLSGSANPIRRESLDQGGLDIIWAPPTGPWGLVKAAASRTWGITGMEDLNSRWTGSAGISSRRKRMRVVCDGELIKLTPPLNLRSHPGALEVLVP